MRKEKAEQYFSCPVCGAQVKEGAPACPHCGSDERTGWSDTAYLQQLGVSPDYDEEAYQETIEREIAPSKSRFSIARLLTGAVVTVMVIVFFFTYIAHC